MMLHEKECDILQVLQIVTRMVPVTLLQNDYQFQPIPTFGLLCSGAFLFELYLACQWDSATNTNRVFVSKTGIIRQTNISFITTSLQINTLV